MLRGLVKYVGVPAAALYGIYYISPCGPLNACQTAQGPTKNLESIGQKPPVHPNLFVAQDAAYLSEIVYDRNLEKFNKKDLNKEVEQTPMGTCGIKTVRIYNLKNGFQAAVFHSREVLAVSVRGTDERVDWFRTNLKLDPIQLDGTESGLYHGGFASKLHSKRFYKKTVSDIEAALAINPDVKILITGHSLGAAIGVCLAAQLMIDHPEWNDKVTVVTFGQPPCCDSVAEKAITSSGIHFERYENRHDIVPRLNLPIMEPDENFHKHFSGEDYTHGITNPRYIDGEGTVHADRDCSAYVKLNTVWHFLARHIWLVSACVDHPMADYKTAMENLKLQPDAETSKATACTECQSTRKLAFLPTPFKTPTPGQPKPPTLHRARLQVKAAEAAAKAHEVRARLHKKLSANVKSHKE